MSNVAVAIESEPVGIFPRTLRGANANSELSLICFCAEESR
jgi:hypothetical protein